MTVYLTHDQISAVAEEAVGTPTAQRLARTYSVPPAAIYTMLVDALNSTSFGNPIRGELESFRKTYEIQKAASMKQLSHEQAKAQAAPNAHWPLATAVFEAKMDFLQWMIKNDLMQVGREDVSLQVILSAKVVDVEAGPLARTAEGVGQVVVESFEYRPWKDAQPTP